MKTLGLLGGMTYHSTLTYYSLINARINTRLGRSHSARILLHSFDFQETSDLFSAGKWNDAAELFINAAKHMELGGAEGILFCVNIAHKVFDQVEKAVGVPMLHIIDFTGRAVQAKGLKKVGLLGTGAVMEQDFIKGRLISNLGLEVIIPKPEDCQAINDIIFGELAVNKVTDKTKAFFGRVVDDMIKDGVEGIIFACTDLQFVLKQEEVSVPLFDTAELHAVGAADWAIDS
jgi:aspartate racemase